MEKLENSAFLKDFKENHTICQTTTPKSLKILEKLENPKENWKIIGKHWKNWKTEGFSRIFKKTMTHQNECTHSITALADLLLNSNKK